MDVLLIDQYDIIYCGYVIWMTCIWIAMILVFSYFVYKAFTYVYIDLQESEAS